MTDLAALGGWDFLADAERHIRTRRRWDVALAVTRVRLVGDILPGADPRDPETTVRGHRLQVLGPVLTHGSANLVRLWHCNLGLEVRQVRNVVETCRRRAGEPDGWWRDYDTWDHVRSCSRPEHVFHHEVVPGWNVLLCPECNGQLVENEEYRRRLLGDDR
ncbi:hypothetical protein [Barrientosiimonas humi]|uniref:hypothetical protein n=1 Tax=Barrientosiimonas humi TaxID=999931 RepID=UPI00114ED09A|nr:hypothetical protein [Barrientosiimonas humi]